MVVDDGVGFVVADRTVVDGPFGVVVDDVAGGNVGASVYWASGEAELFAFCGEDASVNARCCTFVPGEVLVPGGAGGWVCLAPVGDDFLKPGVCLFDVEAAAEFFKVDQLVGVFAKAFGPYFFAGCGPYYLPAHV